MNSRPLSLGLLLVAAGCASVDPGPDYERAREEIRAATGIESVHDPLQRALAPDEIGVMLQDGLGLDEALRLALLNNRRLQVGFLELGVARADVEQAGLLSNPSLALAFLFPSGGGHVRWTADLLADVAELWRLPAREAAAERALDERLLELSRFAGELVAATKSAYFECRAAREARTLAADASSLAERAHAGVQRRVEEGVASAVELSLAESAALEAQLEAQRSRLDEAEAARRLATLLSLDVDLLPVELVDVLPEPRWQPSDLEVFVADHLFARADVRAAEASVASAERALALERRRRWPDLQLGLSAERPEGSGAEAGVLGPGAVLEVPVFDTNAVQVSRAELVLAAERKSLEGVRAEAAQELRAAFERVRVRTEAARFVQSSLLPQAERGAQLAATAVELGESTVLSSLAAQAHVVEARREALAARLAAALALVAAERAAGAPLATQTTDF